jgi:hypothetical protein
LDHGNELAVLIFCPPLSIFSSSRMVDAFDPEMVKKREEAAEARRLAREAVKPSVTGALAQDPQVSGPGAWSGCPARQC